MIFLVLRTRFVLPFALLWLVHGLNLGVRAQGAVEPEAPAQVVLQHAQKLLNDGHASKCERACASIATSMASAQQVGFAADMSHILWSSRQGELTPTCLVKPASAAEISSVLLIVQEEACAFAVLSGGHSRFAGASNSDGGVTISLEFFKEIAFTSDKSSVWIGAGLTWGEVYAPVEMEGKLVLGGRIESVGVGGLLLGGGISWLSGLHGWACDKIVAYEIILPSGEITIVDQQNHADLFRALKGAGAANFGIVTRFLLETFDWSSIYIHLGYYGDSYTETLMDAKQDLLRQDTDANATFLQTFVYHSTEKAYMTALWQLHTSHGTVERVPAALSKYTAIEALTNDTAKLLPYSEVTKEVSKVQPPKGKREIFITFTHRPSREFDAEIVQALKRLVVPIVKDVKGLFPVVTTQKIWPSMMNKERQGFWDVTGMDEEDGPLVVVLFPWAWDERSDDELVTTTARNYLNHLQAVAHDMGIYHPFKYINYLESWQDPWEGWKAESLQWLREVQREYDPNQVFTMGGLGDGYFKLNRKETASEVPKDEL